ncbi:MAG: SGNH/GDSL hydrolase family protein [Hormoscilla sp.]
MTLNPKHILLTALLLLALGGSIVLNFRLYNRAKQYYLELNETRLDPLGLSHYPINLQQLPNANKMRVIFLGDSRAASWIAPQLDGYRFINRGVCSQTSVQTIGRFAEHLGFLQDGDVVVIQVGINDLKTIALFPERRQSIVANCKNNIQAIVEASRKKGATVIVTTIFPVGEVPLERKPFWSDAIDRAITDVNAYIETLAEDGSHLFDVFSLLADSEGMMQQQYAKDELHLNERGYAILNQKLVQILLTIQSQTTDPAG